MALYEVIANWAGWPAVVAMLIIAGGFGYWVLKNRMDLLKEKNEWLREQLEQLEKESPDILAHRLTTRVEMQQAELERLGLDKEANQSAINQKEAELKEVNSQISDLQEQLEENQLFLSDSELVCPNCGDPLSTRTIIPVYFDDMEGESERITYICGLELIDGNVQRECSEWKNP